MKRHFANMVFALILAAYTVYAALDTFVIVRVLTPDTLPTATAEASTAPTEAPTAAPTATESPAEQATTAPISADTEYHDDQIDIVLTTMRVENTTVYVADVQIADISLLKTALAGNTYARNLTETTSVQAANAGAILAINGDYYGAQECGYVLRNGVLYRASAQSGTDALVIGADGNFRIINEGETSADTLVREGAWQVLTFGPALINGGQQRRGRARHDLQPAHRHRANQRRALPAGRVRRADEGEHRAFLAAIGRADAVAGRTNRLQPRRRRLFDDGISGARRQQPDHKWAQHPRKERERHCLHRLLTANA